MEESNHMTKKEKPGNSNAIQTMLLIMEGAAPTTCSLYNLVLLIKNPLCKKLLKNMATCLLFIQNTIAN
jgi:hypothetical protein